MKIKSTLLVIATVAFTSFSSSAFDLKGLLGGSSSSDAINGLVNTVTNLVGGDVEYKSLVGDWKYAKPAVSFKSQDFLSKAGGAAASTMIVDKLAPYYKKAGLTSLKLTFNEDNTFSGTIGKLKVQGTVEEVKKGEFTFNFKAFGQVPTGKITAFVSRNGANINITFDAHKLLSLVKTLSTVSGNSTLQSVSKLLDSYDGVNIGVEIKK